MKLLDSKTLDEAHKEAVRQLWNEEYPESIVLKSLKDLDDYLDKQQDQRHVLLLDENENVIGWFFGFIRDKERWFAIIMNGKKHKKGYGTILLNNAKLLYSELNGWVITDSNYTKQNGSPYISPLRFYLKNGFSVLKNERLVTDKMKAEKIKWERG
jgi:hypothetical protein